MTDFPTDWNEWQAAWAAWYGQHGSSLVPVPKAIPGKNFLADEIIGTYRLPDGRTVELSEVTFPNLSDRDAATGRLIERTDRAIGLTWTRDRQGKVVTSFDELEQELGLQPPPTWPKGIRSRVSREAYYAVQRARGFQFMTPAEREAAAVSYDQLKEERS